MHSKHLSSKWWILLLSLSSSPPLSHSLFQHLASRLKWCVSVHKIQAPLDDHHSLPRPNMTTKPWQFPVQSRTSSQEGPIPLSDYIFPQVRLMYSYPTPVKAMISRLLGNSSLYSRDFVWNKGYCYLRGDGSQAGMSNRLCCLETDYCFIQQQLADRGHVLLWLICDLHWNKGQ